MQVVAAIMSIKLRHRGHTTVSLLLLPDFLEEGMRHGLKKKEKGFLPLSQHLFAPLWEVLALLGRIATSCQSSQVPRRRQTSGLLW